MKCVRCGHDSTYPQRVERRCPSCRGEFAFEPRTGDLVSDTAFKRAIDRVSSEGAVWWGVEHLYYEVRRAMPASWKPLGGCLLVLAIPAFLFSITALGSLALGLTLTGALVAIGIALLIRAPRPKSLDRDKFESMWTRWQAVHGAPPKLITRREIPPPRKELPPDLMEYSFDRVVVCDRARTVDLLVANQFHFENNCAILARGGYPANVFDTVLKMLKNNPRLDVYVLHDATPSGCALAHDVARSDTWFAGRFKVVDVGLRPRHAQKQRGFWEKQSSASIDPVALAALEPAERRWLAEGWTMELATIRPEQVIKRLYRAIAADRADTSSGSDGGGVVLMDTSTMGTDASASDGGGDSFG